MIILSVDPGTRGCGCALWRDSRLIAAEYVKNSAKKGSGPFECAGMAIEVRVWAALHVGGFLPADYDRAVDRLVLEFPQTYGGRAARGDANDLFPLAAIDGAIVALFPLANVTSYFPREWKGSIDPDVMIERIKSRLSSEETARITLPSAKSLSHNIFDAIGVGLKFLNRLEPIRQYARE